MFTPRSLSLLEIGEKQVGIYPLEHGKLLWKKAGIPTWKTKGTRLGISSSSKAQCN